MLRGFDCGSGFIREDGVSGYEVVDHADAFANEFAPTGKGADTLYNRANSGKSPLNPNAWRTNAALASGIWLTSFRPVLRSHRNGS